MDSTYPLQLFGKHFLHKIVHSQSFVFKSTENPVDYFCPSGIWEMACPAFEMVHPVTIIKGQQNKTVVYFRLIYALSPRQRNYIPV